MKASFLTREVTRGSDRRVTRIGSSAPRRRRGRTLMSEADVGSRRNLLWRNDGAPGEAKALCLVVLNGGDKSKTAVAQEYEWHVLASGIAATWFPGFLTEVPGVGREGRCFRDA